MGFCVCFFISSFFGFFHLNPLHEKSQEGKGNMSVELLVNVYKGDK